MAKDKMEKLMIIDGNALIHRSFHALPPTMTTRDGIMTNAVYGFVSVLLKAIREFAPDYIALTLDRKAPTFRHREYAEYKATRIKAPDDLYKQIPLVKKVAEAFSIPLYEMDGLEADDLIGTIARAVDGNVEKIIVTGDLDTLQLINNQTKVFTMSHGLSDSLLYDEKTVKARYELAPEQLIDFKALRGDPSDNIPGVKGIGEKTAIELLKEFKTLDNLYQYAEKITDAAKSKIKPRILELLKQHKKEAYLSKKLATVKTDAPLHFKLADARFGDFNKEKVAQIFSELEFKSLLPRIKDLNGGGEESKIKNSSLSTDKFARDQKMFKYYLVETTDDFRKFFGKLKKLDKFTFDTETSSFDPLTAELLGISFSWQEGQAYYLKIRGAKIKEKTNNLFNYREQKKEPAGKHPWLENLQPIFAAEKIKKSGHNIKFDLAVLKSAGLLVRGLEFDTMIASYLLNPGSRQHNLDAVAFSELGFEKISKDDLLGKGREKISFAEVEEKKLFVYSCEDADFTNRLAKKLAPELKKQKLLKLFSEIEMPLIPVLARMEENGIKISRGFLHKKAKEFSERINKITKEIHKSAGVKFNINSTQQLREVLFEKLAIPVWGVKKGKTGLSTAAEELEKLKNSHPIIKLIQENRELEKLKNTYLDALPKLVNKKTGRLHTSFNQTITATGRLSSTEPNLQNIPARTREGQAIRRAFIADTGYKLVSFDYSQIELRLAAALSEDKKMTKAFLDGADIHTATAAEINQVSPEAVTKEMRREAKAINFGILYGQGPHGLSQAASIPYSRAQEFIEQYFLIYEGIKKFIEKTINQARERGYVETLFGRRRYLPEINSSVMQVKKAAERMAINAPLQGTAADLIKLAMIKIDQLIARKYENGEVKMLLQVHDELLFEIKESKLRETSKEIQKIMENVIKLKVPIAVDIKTGDNWGELE